MHVDENQRSSQGRQGSGFPIEAKLAIGVISLGVIGLILKTFGLF